MREQRTNFDSYTSSLKVIASKNADITHLIRKNRIEEKNEKKAKFYTLMGFFGLVIVLCTIAVYL